MDDRDLFFLGFVLGVIVAALVATFTITNWVSIDEIAQADAACEPFGGVKMVESTWSQKLNFFCQDGSKLRQIKRGNAGSP